MDRKVVITRSIYTVEASNEDQALMNNIRKKDMINNLDVILTFVIIEPLEWRPTILTFLVPAVRQMRRLLKEMAKRANLEKDVFLHCQSLGLSKILPEKVKNYIKP